MITTTSVRLALALGAIVCLGLTGCSAAGADSSPSEAAAQPVDLDGQWKQINSASEDSYQIATISGDTIEISWVSDGGDTTSLYWAGSVEVPADGSTSFTWDSVNDTTKTADALLASSDATKTMTYDGGEISYDVTVLGTTTTVLLDRGE